MGGAECGIHRHPPALVVAAQLLWPEIIDPELRCDVVDVAHYGPQPLLDAYCSATVARI